MNVANQISEGDPTALKDMQPKGVGILFDDLMLEPRCIWVPTYPECPSRLKTSIDRCRYYNLFERCTQIPTRIATEEEVLQLHSKEYYDLIKSSATMTLDELKVLSGKFDAAYFHPKTFAAAIMAAGCAIEAMEQVVAGKVRHSMALVRPPGHHALRTEACGYCIFNNAALAAKHAVDRLGLKRVLVVDWDLHHGQGTQYMFYEDPRVVYFSIHRYEHGTFWPYLRQSDYDFVGQGFNVNVPFNKVGMKDSDYLAIMQQVLMPLACEFNPELVIVSSGYDAAIGDAEGRSELTPAVYAHFTHMMKGLAGGKVCIIFEGGYCLKSLGEGVALTLRTLLDDPCPLLQPLTPVMDSTKESILHTIRVLRPFWKCFAYQDDVGFIDDELPDLFRNIEIPKKGVAFFTDETRPVVFELDGYESYLEEEHTACDEMIDAIIKNTSLYKPPNRTCVCYDEIMCLHKYGDTEDDHPERPRRLTRIISTLQDSGILSRCKVLPSRTATDEELCLIHKKGHVEKVKSFEGLSSEEMELIESTLNSIYLSKDVFRCAVLAVGCTLNVVDEVVSGQSLNGLAIVRPPGHHAESDTPMGFCFFNTVAIAAKYAQQRHGVQKVLILDWDIHHGNGTQHAFYEDPSVLYISIHRGKGAYPDVDDKYAADVGHGPGKGYNVNIAWSRPGMSDCDYLAAFQQVILPVAYEFAPDLVLVSAGFDAAVGDHLGGCKVTADGFGQMTHLLGSLANGRIILVLEGGYNLSVMPNCVASCTSVLLGDAVPLVKLPSSASAVESIVATIDVHKAYWKSLSYRVKMPTRAQTLLWLSNLGHKTVDRPEDKLATALEALEITTEASVPSSQPAVCEASGDSEILCASGGKDIGVQETVGLHQLLQGLAQGQDSLELHAVEPFLYCPHVDVVQPVPTSGLRSDQECIQCGALGENWVCLTCYEVHCSRYHGSHMVEHNHLSKHPVALSYADLSVWCYSCDTYIHHARVTEAKEKAYEDKFNETMPASN